MAIDIETVRQMALALPGTEEYDHFGRPAFKARTTFCTLWPTERRVMVKLSLTDQSVFHSFNPEVFFPVPNKWGLQGCTFADLDKVRLDMLQDALSLAHELASAKAKKKK